jgi:hypothetical protein
MSLRRLIPTILVLSIGLAASLGHGDEKKDKDSQANLMKKKLAASQKLLEGLAQNDFDLISENATALHDISKQAAFKALRTPRYELYAEEFQRSADKLGKAAKDKNLDAAALAYVDMTLNCVKCHQHVREVRRAQGNGQTPDRLALADEPAR